MKKIISILLSFVSIICVVCAFAGCEDKNGDKDSAENAIEVNGKFYALSHAFDNGYIEEEDLKSIACRYYEVGRYEENPYSGLYEEPTQKLDEKIEKELKQAYLEQIEGKKDGGIDKVKIGVYYGLYNGNIVVSMLSDYHMCDYIFNDIFIGEVIFKNSSKWGILVYHSEEDNKQPVEVNGKYYMLTSAYNRDLLNQSDLEKISCGYFEYIVEKFPNNNFGENPYSGIYERPLELLSLTTRNELKQAFLEQIIGYPYTAICDVEIIKYYGTFNGNIIVSLEYRGKEWTYRFYEETEIGGIKFKSYSDGSVLVYHK